MKFVYSAIFVLCCSVEASQPAQGEHLLEQTALLYANAHNDIRSALENLVKLGRLSQEEKQSLESDIKNEKIELNTSLVSGVIQKDTMNWGQFRLRITGPQTLQSEMGTYIRTKGKAPDQIFRDILRVDRPNKTSFFFWGLGLTEVFAVDKNFYSNIGSAYRSAITSLERTSAAIANMWSSLPINQPSKLEQEAQRGESYQNGFLGNLLKSERDLTVRCDKRTGQYTIIHGFNEGVWNRVLEEWHNEAKEILRKPLEKSESQSPLLAVMFDVEVKKQIEKSNQWYKELQLKSLSDERMKKILQTDSVPKCTENNADLIKRALKSEATGFYVSIIQAIARPVLSNSHVVPATSNQR